MTVFVFKEQVAGTKAADLAVISSNDFVSFQDARDAAQSLANLRGKAIVIHEAATPNKIDVARPNDQLKSKMLLARTITAVSGTPVRDPALNQPSPIGGTHPGFDFSTL